MRQFRNLRKSRTVAVVEGASSSTAPDNTRSVSRERVRATDRLTPPPADNSPSPIMLDDSVSPEIESHTGSGGKHPVSSTSSPRHIPLGIPSPKANAALIAFKTALQLLGKAPLPGIGVATGALVEIISRHQDLSQIEEALQRLTNCMEYLWFLVHRVIECDEQNKDLCKPLVQELSRLREDLEISLREGRLVAFFNTNENLRSVNEHISDLDRIIMSLTFFISARTNRTTTELQEEFQKAISAIRTSIQDKDESSSSNEIVIKMSNNEIDGVDGSIASGNTVHGKAGMIQEFHGNKIGHVKGAMFSNNTIINTKSPAVNITSESANDLLRSLGLNLKI